MKKKVVSVFTLEEEERIALKTAFEILGDLFAQMEAPIFSHETWDSIPVERLKTAKEVVGCLSKACDWMQEKETTTTEQPSGIVVPEGIDPLKEGEEEDFQNWCAFYGNHYNKSFLENRLKALHARARHETDDIRRFTEIRIIAVNTVLCLGLYKEV